MATDRKILGLISTIAVLGAMSSSADIARTADGKPDFSGYYDTATQTPLQRPGVFGDKAFVTPEEAERVVGEQLAGIVPDLDNDPNREAPPVGGDGSGGAAGNVGGYNTFWIDAGESGLTVDGMVRTSIITNPTNGRMPQFTPAGMQQRMAAFAGFGRKNEGVAWWVHEGDGSGPYDDPELRPLFERCLMSFTSTAPILPGLYNNHKRIVQTPDHVMIMNEMVHDARVVRMNGTHAPEGVYKWMGDSIGRWEGDTLVVETTNFHPNNQRTITGGAPSLYLTERFSPQENGDLMYSFTVDDPTTWTAAWSGEYRWPKTAEPLYEYACHEGNYSFGNILRGARRLEADALAGGGEE